MAEKIPRFTLVHTYTCNKQTMHVCRQGTYLPIYNIDISCIIYTYLCWCLRAHVCFHSQLAHLQYFIIEYWNKNRLNAFAFGFYTISSCVDIVCVTAYTRARRKEYRICEFNFSVHDSSQIIQFIIKHLLYGREASSNLQPMKRSSVNNNNNNNNNNHNNKQMIQRKNVEINNNYMYVYSHLLTI